MWPRTVVIDLDGTLVDTLPDIAAALNLTLSGAGLEALAPAEVRHLIGGGARALVEKGFAARGIDLEKRDHDARLDAFLSHYADVRAERSAPFPGAVDALERWRSEGRALAICTNKPKPIADIVLADLKLDHYFDVVIGAEEGRPRKPDPAMLLRCLDAVSGSPGDAVLLGDTQTDLKTARASGVRVVLFTFGYSKDDVRSLGPDAVLASWADVDQAFCSLEPVGGSIAPC